MSGGPAEVQLSASPSSIGALALSGGNMTGPIAGLMDKGGQLFNVKAYGAKGDGTTDDTTAIQEAITAAEVSGGEVFFPPGTYKTNAGLTCSSGAISFRGSGTSSILKAGSNNVPLTITGNANVRDIVFDGAGTAPNAAVQSVSVENSYPSLWENVTWQNATGYQYVNSKCEDVVYVNCKTPGNESSPTTVPNAIQITVPNGACQIIGGSIFGTVDLTYQQFSVIGAAIGPLYIENAGASAESNLTLVGCYVYDGGLSSYNCIDTGTNLTNITATGCYFAAQVVRNFVNGNIPAGVTISLTNCVFVWSPGTAGNNYAVQASGAGSLIIEGYHYSVGSGIFSLFNAVSSATTRVTSTDSSGHAIYGYGLNIKTDATDGQNGALTLTDIGTGNNKSIRLDASNNLQILNNAFSAVLLLLNDFGVLQLQSGGGTDSALATVVSSPAITSGTAFTPSSNSDSMVYFQINAAAAGSYTLTMGPTTGSENTIANAVAITIGNDELVTLRVPRNWKVILTATTVTIGQTRVVTC